MWTVIAQANLGSAELMLVGAIGCMMVLPMLPMLAGMWKIFEKAGQPGWAAIVPVYNLWVLVEISGKEAVWFVVFLIPILNFASAIVVNIALAERFGKDSAYGIAMALVPFILYPILGFGEAQYQAQTAGEQAATV